MLNSNIISPSIRKYLLILIFSLTGTYVAVSARVDTIAVHSTVMNKSINNIVITPDTYNKNGGPYSVLYLLHGAGGSYASWLYRVPSMKTYADKYNILMVYPDGGRTSWYFDSPIDKKMQYETYVSSELITYIDNNYNTKAAKGGRAITGFSMGGHGAFYLAFKHQDVWGAAGSMSGGVDIRPFPNNWDIAKRLGPYQENRKLWDESSVINLVNLVKDKDLQLIFDCGVDDFFFDINKSLHEKLIEQKIPHDYIERSGGHTLAYWKNSLKYQLVFFNDFFTVVKTN